MQRALRLGSHGADVVAVQTLLRARGHDPGPSDGRFGPRTDRATRAFQESRGLHADGIVGPQTRAELGIEGSPARRRVARVRTPLSSVALMNVLARGHEAYFARQPTRARLSVAWSHVGLENGRGAEVYCNNLGNITGFRWPGAVYAIHVDERDVVTNRWTRKEMLFRAHDTADEGAASYWQTLTEDYGEAMPLFDLGRPFEAAMKLGELVWFTETPEQYADRMARVHRAFPG